MTSTASTLPGKNILGFLAFSHGWTWFFWIVASFLATSIWRPPAVYLFVLGGLGVLLGGIVMTRLTSGSDGLRDLARRLVDPRRITGRWWAVVLLFFPIMTLLAGALARAAGAAQQPFDLQGMAQRLADPAGLAAMMAFTLVIGPLPEEIGWRGYLLDQVKVKMQGRWGALSAGILVGLLNWIWHLPLFYLPGYAEAFHTVPPTMLQMFFIVVPAVILYVWVYYNTGRSVLAAVLFHFGGNFWGEFFGLSPEAQMYRMILTIIAVALIVWQWGPTTLRRDAQLAVTR
jgi:membrane protease YdiL (CAAX protease family)